MAVKKVSKFGKGTLFCGWHGPAVGNRHGDELVDPATTKCCHGDELIDPATTIRCLLGPRRSTRSISIDRRENQAMGAKPWLQLADGVVLDVRGQVVKMQNKCSRVNVTASRSLLSTTQDRKRNLHF